MYLLDERVGHLGIFVSADIALHRHRAILHHAHAIQSLAPGLYQMRIDADGGAVFEPRQLEDIAFDPQPAPGGRSLVPRRALRNPGRRCGANPDGGDPGRVTSG